MDGPEPKARPPAARLALEWLARKPLTALELRRGLSRSGHGEAEIETTLAELEREGYVDDRRLALHYLLSRSERLGHAPARLLRELGERGVCADALRRAWDEAVDDHGLDPERLLERAVEKRLPPGGLDRRLARRVYNALLRAGFEAHAVRQALITRLRGDTAGLDESDAET